jgi:hypothetical protein
LDVLAHTVGMKIEVFVGKRCFLRSLLSELVKAAVKKPDSEIVTKP